MHLGNGSFGTMGACQLGVRIRVVVSDSALEQSAD